VNVRPRENGEGPVRQLAAVVAVEGREGDDIGVDLRVRGAAGRRGCLGGRGQGGGVGGETGLVSNVIGSEGREGCLCLCTSVDVCMRFVCWRPNEKGKHRRVWKCVGVCVCPRMFVFVN